MPLLLTLSPPRTNLSNICSPAVSAHRFNPATHPPASLLTLSLLRGAEQMGMHKAVKPQFGGGMRRFSCEEDNIYENIESELCFFTSQVGSPASSINESMKRRFCSHRFVFVKGATCNFSSFKFQNPFHDSNGSQERQSIIKYWLDNLRAKQGEVLHNIHFLEGQPISTLIPFTIILSASLLIRSCCPSNLPYAPLGKFSLPTILASVPELVARGVIHQMFPLHEQRILNQLMTSWVQAVCERQPLGRKQLKAGLT